ncbi:MAG: LamG domain-containing protein [Planctomycetaceae bacterium]|nr:LamG domain-containing protein [Planctomycetaceae bacterium]
MHEPSSAISPPETWGAQKPPCGITIDRSHPLGSRTIAAFLFDNRSSSFTRDSVAGATGMSSSGVVGDCDNTGPFWKFNGSSSYASIPLTLCSFSAISVELKLWWNNYSTTDNLAIEYGADSNNKNAFYIDPNCGLGTFRVMMTAGGGSYLNRAADFPRPSATAWHHYVAVLDRVSQTVTPYLDGRPVSFATSGSSTFPTGRFGDYTLYLMSRGGTALFGGGKISLLRLYAGVLNAADVLNLFNRPFCMYRDGSALLGPSGQRRPLVDGSLSASPQLTGAAA